MEFLVIFGLSILAAIVIVAVALYAGKKTADHVFEHASGEFTTVSICGTCGDIDATVSCHAEWCRRCGAKNKSEAIAQYKSGSWRNQAGFPI